MKPNEVKYELTDGDRKEEATSGSHFGAILSVLDKWYGELSGKCEELYKKHFGPDTEFHKLQQKIIEMSNSRKPEEQTDEDRKLTMEFLQARNKVAEAYLSEAPKVKLTWSPVSEDKEDTLFEGDLRSVREHVKSQILDGRGIVEVLQQAIFDVMRRSGVKLAAIVLATDPEATGKSSGEMMFGSPFCQILPEDIRAMAGRLELVRDVTLKNMSEKLGIPMAEENRIIVPGQP